MSAPQKPAAAAPHDPIQEMAEKLYVALCARVYSAAGEKPQPKAVAQLCFKLAETFQAANYEFNPTAVAARAAKDKASVSLDSVNIDFGAVGKS
ncbi:MAG TPA: hypothetical protein VFB53_06915 [Burkholderiales bacterium]|nr:hypothetical protein [Burkholderiales bacterium]